MPPDFNVSRHPKRSFVPLALAINLATFSLLSLGISAPVAAQSEVQRYAIAPGALGPALNLFAQQARVALLFDARSVAGLSTAGLQGEFAVNQGFAQLLQGSGFQAVQGASGF